MKKYLALIICTVLAVLSLAGCGKTNVFGYENPFDYVKLGDYKNITVDKGSKDYKNYYTSIHLRNVRNKNAYHQKNGGKIELGDIANIDFVGKIDGSEFNGGSNMGYNLTIGAGQFIPGFEDGLIGVEVGQTVDLNLKFPDDYDQTTNITENSEVTENTISLAGQDVVFTVTVNYRSIPMTMEESYELFGFKTLKDYQNSIDEECKENFVIKQFLNDGKFDGCPTKDSFKTAVFLTYYDLSCQSTSGVDLETHLASNESDINTFAGNIVSNIGDDAFESPQDIKNVKNTIMGCYAVMDKEGLKIDESKLKDYENYELYYREALLVKDVATKFLVKNAKFIDTSK